MALIATATLSVKEDVVQAVGLANCIVFRKTFREFGRKTASYHGNMNSEEWAHVQF
ncbi:hypothetical protein KP509_25G055900 [Ceratopteris richardii]|uniref:Uncharacterized protein n=1 Tax=Ceratopteris richardii TaxID=49495 RepID=A0A8T2RQI3_CERRI|nr:hypothetical protein KP509_25G055900 [Ceratopteris richardii]